MSPRVTMNPAQWAKYMVGLGPKLLPAAERGLYAGALRALPKLQLWTRTAQAANPTNTGQGGAVNTGAFLRGWKARAIAGGAEVRNDAPYSGVVEYGRRAGARAPPRAEIARWVQRRMGLSEKEARSVAFLIARSIKRRGLKGRHILTSDEHMRELVAAVTNEMVAELDRELEK